MDLLLLSLVTSFNGLSLGINKTRFRAHLFFDASVLCSAYAHMLQIMTKIAPTTIRAALEASEAIAFGPRVIRQLQQ